MWKRTPKSTIKDTGEKKRGLRCFQTPTVVRVHARPKLRHSNTLSSLPRTLSIILRRPFPLISSPLVYVRLSVLVYAQTLHVAVEDNVRGWLEEEKGCETCIKKHACNVHACTASLKIQFLLLSSLSFSLCPSSLPTLCSASTRLHRRLKMMQMAVLKMESKAKGTGAACTAAA
jgi:hypothetical protein